MILDDPALLAKNDPSGMLGVVAASADQWKQGFARARATPLPIIEGIENVCVFGMGGSGISGDVLAAFATTRSRVPVIVSKGFAVPAWVGERTLAICVSYSGGTHEALVCYDDARHRGAYVVVVSGGGELTERAVRDGVPCVDPGHGLMPRAALPSLASAALVIGEASGLLDDLQDEEEALRSVLASCMEMWGPDVAKSKNVAKQLAVAIHGSAPQVWGQEGMLEVGALRWKCQLNENAKMNASNSTVPEALHNEIVPLEAAVLLRTPIESEPVARRLDAVAMSYDGVIEFEIPGLRDLAQFGAAALAGDLVSVYCSALREVDPTPIDAILRLKRLLD